MTLKIVPAAPKACVDCPWRLINQGRTPDPHKFYARGNLARLWVGLRRGERQTCHPTDPRTAEFSGYEACADQQKVAECAGALTLQQREVSIFQRICQIQVGETRKTALREYRTKRPNGLLSDGLRAVVARAIVHLPFDGAAMTRLDLDDREVGYDRVEWSTALRDWTFPLEGKP